MSQLIRKIEKEAILDTLRYDDDKYKGDGFEFFVEWEFIDSVIPDYY